MAIEQKERYLKIVNMQHINTEYDLVKELVAQLLSLKTLMLLPGLARNRKKVVKMNKRLSKSFKNT